MNPLDQLADITPPNAVSVWPLAWGYWLALVLVLAMIGYSIFAIVQFRKKRQVKREALQALANLELTNEYYAHRVQVLMKSLCSHYLSSSSSSQMHGKQWQLFVLSMYRGKDSERLSQVLDRLYQALYSPELLAKQSSTKTNEQIQTTINEWISTSFPCKKVANSQTDSASINATSNNEVRNA